MIPSVLVLVERTLRVDARAWAPHLARFGLMMAVYISVITATATSSVFGAPGLNFFRSMAYLNLIFMTLMGIGFFSTTITEEKEEDTLGLMLMAGISPLSLLLGKSVGRLVGALLLIAIQYPFTLLAITLGGVTQHQIQSAYLAMFAYLAFLSGVGLLCSTLSRQNRTASIRMTYILAAYILVPSLCLNLLTTTGWLRSYTAILNSITESCVFLQMNTIMTTGFDAQLLAHPLVLSNVAIGALGYLLSWALFGSAVKDLSSEPISRGLTASSSNSSSLFSAGRPKVNPFVWKDFHFSSGGLTSIMIRVALYPLLYVAAVLMDRGTIFGPWGPSGQKTTTGMYLVLAMIAIAIDAGLLTSRCFHDEVRGQTLAALMMLPTSAGQILYAKLFGALLAWLPGPVFLVSGILFLPYGRECFKEFFERPGAPLWLIAHLILIPHAAAVAALYVRWGALPLAIGIAIGSGFVSGSFFAAIRAGDNHPAVFFVAFVVFTICGLCHIVVRLRTEALTAK